MKDLIIVTPRYIYTFSRNIISKERNTKIKFNTMEKVYTLEELSNKLEDVLLKNRMINIFKASKSKKFYLFKKV